MKFIFLDIDGVVNCNTTKERCGDVVGVEQEKIALVKQIVDATGAKIVLSSTWRLDMIEYRNGVAKNLYDYNYLVGEFAKQGLEFYDITPHHKDDWRGREILDWLSQCKEPIEGYVVIDDDVFDIVTECRGHVLITSPETGLKPNGVKWAIQILNNGKGC